MKTVALPPIELQHPATFRSRGVAAPFTTPLLAGARVRESKDSSLELVVPNPSGGRGVYIVQWPGVRALCNPTVHDTILFQSIGRLPGVDPATVRDAALDVALAGYAGRDALAAAQAARKNDRQHHLLTDFLFLAVLSEQLEPTGQTATILAERTPDFDRRAGLVLRRIAPSLGCSAAHLTIGLAALGNAFAPIGIRQDDQTARIPRLISRLKETHADLSLWLTADPENDLGGLGRTVTATMQWACNCTDAVLANTQSAIADPLTLMKRWIAKADDPLSLASRCDWMLDGWERICLLWKTAASMASRRAALLEMAQLLPVIPREVDRWLDGPIPPEVMDQARHASSQNDGWPGGGSAFALIQRNEMLRALSW